MSATGPRPAKVVLQDALAELRDRERKLVRVAEEIAEVRAAINALHELGVRDDPPKPEPTPPAAPAVRMSLAPGNVDAVMAVARRDREQRMLAAVKKHQPAQIGTLLQETGLSNTRAKAVLNELRERHLVQRVGRTTTTRYWLTEELDRLAAENDGAIPAEEAA